MKQAILPQHGHWANRWVFIMAATGSAVGLGNIWRFPYIVGEHGGGAFVLLYLLCVFVVGIPIMAAEVLLGRKGAASPINSVKRVALQSKVTQRWASIGYLGALAAFLILSFYSVVASWGLYYIWEALRGAFVGITADASQAHFDSMLDSPGLMFGYHTLFMLLTMFVVGLGVKKGLERAVQILMPLLFILLFGLVGYAATTNGFADGVSFLFAPDFSRLTGQSVMVAVGQAFFTLSLGMGAIMAYGAYMPRERLTRNNQRKPVSIMSAVVIIALLDALVAIGAGLAIFPLLFTYGLEVSQGPGMMFVTLPLAFGQMPGGLLVGTLFFVLLVSGAWTSSISLGEPVVAWMVERGVSRPLSALIVGVTAWLLGIGSLLSFNLWKDQTFLMGTFFDNIEFFSTTILLPIGGLLIAIFVGWVVKETQVRKELAMKNFKLYLIWRAVVRLVAPLAVIGLFVYSIMATFQAPQDVTASESAESNAELSAQDSAGMPVESERIVTIGEDDPAEESDGAELP